MAVLGHFTSWQSGEEVISSEPDSLPVKWGHSPAAPRSEGQGYAPKAWHMCNRLPRSFVTAKGGHCSIPSTSSFCLATVFSLFYI